MRATHVTRSRRVACALWLTLAATLAPAAPPSESFVEVAGPQGPLKGTLLLPAEPRAAVLVIPGSGPTDRDGNGPLGLKASSYRLLAEALSAQGIAVLRFDKRGLFASAAAVPDANAVTLGDYAEDVRAWAGLLRQRSGLRCTWLLGHSEGGVVALLAAARVPDLCGLLLLATPGRPLGEVLRAQLKANPANAPLLAPALAAIAALEQGRRVEVSGLHPALQGLFNPSLQGFLIDAFSHDPQRLVAAVKQPVLVLQGQRDLQLQEVDARALQRALPQARLVLLPGVNHVLKAVAGEDLRANVATYADPSLPLAPGVVEAVLDFVGGATRP